MARSSFSETDLARVFNPSSSNDLFNAPGAPYFGTSKYCTCRTVQSNLYVL